MGSRPTSTQLEMLGSFIGRLHMASEQYIKRGQHVFRPIWNRSWKFDASLIPRNYQETIQGFSELCARLCAPSDHSGFGLIHADLTPDNFRYTSKGIFAFDFDDCMYCWYLYDIAVVLYTLCGGTNVKGNINVSSVLATLIRGYEKTAGNSLLKWELWSEMQRLQLFEQYLTCIRLGSSPEDMNHLRALIHRP